MCVFVCVCVCVRACVFVGVCVLWHNWLECVLRMETSAPCVFLSSNHSDCELWHNFIGQESHTQLPLS